MTNRLFYVLLLTLSFSSPIVSQVFEPGVPYVDSTGFIEYIAGNVPVIISAPHGGYLEPDGIPDCPNCSTFRDAYTQEIGRGISDAFFEQTGCYPNVIINLLHRRKLNMNLPIEGATGNVNVPILENARETYHAFIDSIDHPLACDPGYLFFKTGAKGDLHPVWREIVIAQKKEDGIWRGE